VYHLPFPSCSRVNLVISKSLPRARGPDGGVAVVAEVILQAIAGRYEYSHDMLVSSNSRPTGEGEDVDALGSDALWMPASPTKTENSKSSSPAV